MDQELLEDIISRLIEVDRSIAFINKRYLEKSPALAHTLEAREALSKALTTLETQRPLPPLARAWLAGYSIDALAQDHAATEHAVEHALRDEFTRLGVNPSSGAEGEAAPDTFGDA